VRSPNARPSSKAGQQLQHLAGTGKPVAPLAADNQATSQHQRRRWREPGPARRCSDGSWQMVSAAWLRSSISSAPGVPAAACCYRQGAEQTDSRDRQDTDPLPTPLP